MKNSFDVVALGELLIDFTENGLSEQGNPLMHRIFHAKILKWVAIPFSKGSSWLRDQPTA